MALLSMALEGYSFMAQSEENKSIVPTRKKHLA